MSNAVCEEASLCEGEGVTYGYYSEAFKKCLCRNAPNSGNACDATCQYKALKAYLRSTGQVCLQAADVYKCYNKTEFGTALDGLTCSKDQCPITNQGSFEAAPVFVNRWLRDFPNYVPPYVNSTVTLRRYL